MPEPFFPGGGSDLHRQLRDLVAQVGVDVVEDPQTFRAALDDFLDERVATSGELNLLVDAVRLGALDRTRQQLANGALPAIVVDAQGDLLARDRGTGESRNARWAVAALGFALGLVPEGEVVARRVTSTGLGLSSGGVPAAPPGPPAPPVTSPPAAWGSTQPPSPPVPQPQAPPAHQQQWASYSSYVGPDPSPRRRPVALVMGVVVALLVLIGGGVLAVVAFSGEDDPVAKDDKSGATPSESEEARDPFASLADLEAMAAELFPAGTAQDNSYASSWSTEPSNIVDGETRRLSQAELDQATEWYVRRVEGDQRFYIFVRYLGVDSTYEWSCASYSYCDEVTSDGGLDALVIREEGERDGYSTYYRDIVVPGDAEAGIPEITISENVDDQESGLDAEQFMLDRTVLDLDALIAALDDARLRPPLPETLPPLPSWDACVYNATPPAACSAGVGDN